MAGMKRTDAAQILGVTRQALDFVLLGKRNFSFAKSKKAAELIGGHQTIWQDPERVPERRAAWEKFKEAKP